MMQPFSLENLLWWVTAVEIPVLTALFGLIMKTRASFESSTRRLYQALAALRVELAQNYAQNATVRELENRLTAHLLRIEAKLDVTAIKAEVLSAREIPHKQSQSQPLRMEE